jgi:hypothetical protein
MNSYATPTCATNGKQVVAFFGPAGIHCFDLKGEEKWSRELGAFPGPWGVAASPIILGDLVIQNCDAEGASSLIALSLEKGEPVWQTEREKKPRGGWSTPIVIENGDRKELVLNGELGVRGYDPKTGKELWFCESFNGRGSPVPDFFNGISVTWLATHDVKKAIKKIRNWRAPSVEGLTEPQFFSRLRIVSPNAQFSVEDEFLPVAIFDHDRCAPPSPRLLFSFCLPNGLTLFKTESDE